MLNFFLEGIQYTGRLIDRSRCNLLISISLIGQWGVLFNVYRIFRCVPPERTRKDKGLLFATWPTAGVHFVKRSDLHLFLHHLKNSSVDSQICYLNNYVVNEHHKKDNL